MRYCSGNGDFHFIYRKLPYIIPLREILSTETLNRTVASTHYWGDCLILDFLGTGFTAKMFRLCRHVITSRLDVYFERSGRRSLPNMPYRLHGSGFCRGVPRGTFLITRSEAHCIYIAKLASLSTLVKGKTRSLQQSSFFLLDKKEYCLVNPCRLTCLRHWWVSRIFCNVKQTRPGAQ